MRQWILFSKSGSSFNFTISSPSLLRWLLKTRRGNQFKNKKSINSTCVKRNRKDTPLSFSNEDDNPKIMTNEYIQEPLSLTSWRVLGIYLYFFLLLYFLFHLWLIFFLSRVEVFSAFILLSSWFSSSTNTTTEGPIIRTTPKMAKKATRSSVFF